MRFACICASNVNRSVAAHMVLKEAGLEVESFGCGRHIKLPGPSADAPNVYQFGVATYQSIHDDLRAKDESLYRRTGLLDMLERDVLVKPAPQRWQDHPHERFDVAVTFERRVMEQVVEDMAGRQGDGIRPLLVVNLDVKDNTREAATAAPQALQLCQMLEAAEDWETEVDEVVAQFEAETGRRPLYTLCWY